MIAITKAQARRFMLLHHGLLGERRYVGQDGIRSFVHHVGALQYDPVDICGKNADIVLCSRVLGYQKSDLSELLYTHRKLIDFFDKNLCIIPTEYFQTFLHEKLSGGYAEYYAQKGGEAVAKIKPLIYELIKQRGHVSSREIDVKDSLVWDWGISTSVARAALESMYFGGELIIHHKKGTVKSYARTEDHIPSEILNAPLPYKTNAERDIWHIYRRIRALGMLWNKASDAWLGLRIKAAGRAAVFVDLLKSDKIVEISVDGIKEPLYVAVEDMETLEAAMRMDEYEPRTEFIAPLDSFMWDRKLIAALFNFEYKWEIYTPQVKRQYGPYTLPILRGESLVGRIDMARKDGAMVINNIWMQDGERLEGEMKRDIDECLGRFCGF